MTKGVRGDFGGRAGAAVFMASGLVAATAFGQAAPPPAAQPPPPAAQPPPVAQPAPAPQPAAGQPAYAPPPGQPQAAGAYPPPQGQPAPQGYPPPQGQPAPQGYPPPQGQPAPQGYPPPQGQPAPQGYPPPQGQPAPQGYPPPQGQPPPQGYAQPGYTEPPPPPAGPSEEMPLPGFAIPLRLYLSPGGSGTREVKCDGSDCGDFSGGDGDYKHHFGIGIGADFLWTVGSAFRLGPGIQINFADEIDADDGPDDYEVGTDVAVDFVAEGMFHVGPKSWLGPRGQLGVTVLAPSGDLEDDLKAFKDSCEALSASGCDNLEGAKPGVNFGIGGGFMHAISNSLRFRADLMLQWYLINIYTLEYGSGIDATVEDNLNGNRLFITAGLEL